MNIDSDYVILAVIVVVLLMVRAARVRRYRKRAAYIDSVTEGIAEKLAESDARADKVAEPHPDWTTPVCPICGKVDERNPFIKHAMSCYRRDCGA